MEKIRDDHLNHFQVVTSFESLIQGYILNCRCEGKSPRTVEYYRDHLKRFLWYCDQFYLPPDPTKITTYHIRQFLWYISSEPVRWGGRSQTARRPMGPTTVSHYYHCLHILFEWLKSEGLVAGNPVSRISRPRKQKKVIQALTENEVRTLLDRCPVNTTPGCRMRAILMVLIDSGMRVSELVDLRVCDVKLDTGSILIRNGKGGKQRVVRIGARTQKVLWRYLTLFRGGESERVFVSRALEPLTVDAIQCLIRRLARRAGIPGVHLHRLRHTFAISFLRAGGDIFSLNYLHIEARIVKEPTTHLEYSHYF